jgi:hypothetical protein
MKRLGKGSITPPGGAYGTNMLLAPTFESNARNRDQFFCEMSLDIFEMGN